MNNNRILCDVDLTIVDPVFSQDGWLDYLKENCTKFRSSSYEKDEIDGRIDYNLANYFRFKDDFDPYSYWAIKGLYENQTPYKSAVAALENLHKKGFHIIFLTHSDLTLSKKAFCYKHFPFITSYIITADKEEVVRKEDIMIDDRLEHLVTSECDCKIKLETPCRQGEGFKIMAQQDNIIRCNTWGEIYHYILDNEV